MKDFKNIIWDWNGTLLDDVDISLATLNEALSRAGIPKIDRVYYREHFDFPVREFYRKVGLHFSDGDFDRYSAAFMDSYLQKSKNIVLFPAAADLLDYFRQNSIKQYVLSAMEQVMLEGMLQNFVITEYFDRIQGLENLHAHSKADAGEKLMKISGADPQQTLMIGDTLHDFEVARKMNVSCFLLASGHQTKQRLEAAGVPVFDNHVEILQYFKKNQ